MLPYPGLGFVVVLGVAIGTALYHYINGGHNHNQHQHQHQRHGYSDGKSSRSNGRRDNCTICLDKLDGIKRVRILPCGHMFHEACISISKSHKTLCPVCDGRSFRSSGTDDNCNLCLGKLQDRFKRVLRTLHCGHRFHDHCITMWLIRKRLCPVCEVEV